MANIIVLGAGLVGGVMAKDLAQNHTVTSIDISQKNLDKLNGINTICADVANTHTLQNLIKDCDLVVGAVPGFMGYKMMKDVIEAGKNIVDISFYPEDPFGLDELAKEKGVVAVMDCGVAPGMGNIIFGHHNSQMKIADYECLVGGLPEKREWPFEYQAVFSPIDVIQEYIRPARYVQNSSLIVKEALSDTELIEFDEIGTLESWNSDGLRSLIKTMAHVPNMIEKTLRYPGCVEYLKVSYQYNLLDRYQDDTISMARTTGFTCTAVANLVIKGIYDRIGISPPEYLGGHFEFVKTYLEKRGVKYIVKKS